MLLAEPKVENNEGPLEGPFPPWNRLLFGEHLDFLVQVHRMEVGQVVEGR